MSRKTQVLEYYQQHLGEWVHNQTLRDLTGLNDVPRTIRLLRQEGWEISIRGDGYSMLSSPTKGDAKGERKAISEKTRFQVFTTDSFRCMACGRSVEEDKIKLNVDHIVPVDWGGTNDISNLQSLCEECNHGKQAWVSSVPSQSMKSIMSKQSVEARIEALFDAFPNQDIPSSMVRLVSNNAFDWQRALRRIRGKTGKQILPIKAKNAYRYHKETP